MPPSGVTTDHHPADVNHRADGLGDDLGQGVDGEGDVVEGAGPAAAGQARPPVFGDADDEAHRGEGIAEWAGMTAVDGPAPEAAVQEDHQRPPTRHRAAASPARASTRQAQVSDLIVARAVKEHVIGAARGPGQVVSLRHDDHFLYWRWAAGRASSAAGTGV